jgi:hypothetical protein
MISLHYMNHHTNLAVQTFLWQGIMGKTEDVPQNLYSYFFHSPKKTQKFVELANIVKTQGQQIFRNIKSC